MNEQKVVLIPTHLRDMVVEFFKTSVTIGDGVDMWMGMRNGVEVSLKDVQHLINPKQENTNKGSAE